MWWGGVGGYDQLCCPASPKLLLGLDLGLGCDNDNICLQITSTYPHIRNSPETKFIACLIIAVILHDEEYIY